MRIYQTDLQKEAAKRPTELDFYLVANRRQLLKTPKEKYKLNRLIAGAEGERIVLEYLKEFGEKHWVVLPNLWLNYFGNFECDLILLTNHKCYLFEIKNYKGDFLYKDGIIKIDGTQKNFNPIQQTRRNYRNLQEIINKVYPHVVVEGATLFTGINNAVFIESEVSDIQIIPRCYLKWYIKQIIKEERNNQERLINAKGIINQFLKYEIQQSYLPDSLSEEQMSIARKGIYCAKCYDYQVKVNRFNVECRCGYKEDRKVAVLRTIYDYAVLNYDKELLRNHLLKFINGQASKTYLVNLLNEYLTAIKKSRSSYYIVENFPYIKSQLNTLSFSQ